jgi:hypothetical protein
MLLDQSPFIQCLLGTGFTWFVTAAGAALVFVFHSPNVCLNKNKKLFHLKIIFLAKITGL